MCFVKAIQSIFYRGSNLVFLKNAMSAGLGQAVVNSRDLTYTMVSTLLQQSIFISTLNLFLNKISALTVQLEIQFILFLHCSCLIQTSGFDVPLLS